MTFVRSAIQRRESGDMGCSDKKSFDEESTEKYNHHLNFPRTLQRASNESAVEENLRVWKNIRLIYILSRGVMPESPKSLYFSVFHSSPREKYKLLDNSLYIFY